MIESAIEVTSLFKSYRRGVFRKPRAVLEDLNFRVPRGAVFGFLGPNGAGKSTTIKALLNFVRPDRGTIRLLGDTPNTASVRRKIGFLPETADYYPFLSPGRLLSFYAEILGIPRSAQRQRIENLLRIVGLANEKDERIGSFSKGMKQRVGIAQALLNEPELLILDEPASGLDPIGMREIRDLIIDQKRAGRTIFFSSHELAEVEAICDEAVIIKSGRIIRSGTLEQLVPYRQELVVRIPRSAQVKLDGRSYVDHILPQVRPDEVSFVARAGNSIAQLAELLRDDGLEPVSIEAVRDSLEDIFVRLMKDADK